MFLVELGLLSICVHVFLRQVEDLERSLATKIETQYMRFSSTEAVDNIRIPDDPGQGHLLTLIYPEGLQQQRN